MGTRRMLPAVSGAVTVALQVLRLGPSRCRPYNLGQGTDSDTGPAHIAGARSGGGARARMRDVSCTGPALIAAVKSGAGKGRRNVMSGFCSKGPSADATVVRPSPSQITVALG